MSNIDWQLEPNKAHAWFMWSDSDKFASYILLARLGIEVTLHVEFADGKTSEQYVTILQDDLHWAKLKSFMLDEFLDQKRFREFVLRLLKAERWFDFNGTTLRRKQ